MTKKTAVLKLETPLKRGDKTIKELTLRKPDSGELRGLKMTALIEADVDSLQILLPRITQPALVGEDVGLMDPADLFDAGLMVANFLSKKEMSVLRM